MEITPTSFFHTYLSGIPTTQLIFIFRFTVDTKMIFHSNLKFDVANHSTKRSIPQILKNLISEIMQNPEVSSHSFFPPAVGLFLHVALGQTSYKCLSAME